MAARVRARKHGKQRPVLLGHIEKLVVENFKSYQGRHEIGPFEKFTCIIGPNGSGKSNVMDAISFCLGIKAKHLRGARLKDLVYRREEESVDSNMRSAKVIMEFRTDSGETIRFGRSIDSAGTGSYVYGSADDQQPITYDNFIKRLADQRIFVKARNFLVFQGDVMELARRQGTDLTGVLETISGSDQCKEEYTRLARELELSREKARMYFQRRREIEGTVAQLEEQRAEVERYQALRAQREALSLEAVLFKLYCTEVEAASNRQIASSLQAEQQAAEAELRQRKQEADEIDVERRKADAAIEKIKHRHSVLFSRVEQLRPELGTCEKQVAHWDKKRKECELNMKEVELSYEGFETSAKEAREERARAEEQIAELRAKQAISAIQMTEAQRSEYYEAVAQTDAVNVLVREKIREVTELLDVAERDHAQQKQDLRDCEMKHSSHIQRIEELRGERMNLQGELDAEAANLSQRIKQVDAVAEEARKFIVFRDSLVEEQTNCRIHLDRGRARRERLDVVEARQRVSDELRAMFPDSVIGRVSELVLPTQRRFDQALQVTMGKMAEAFIIRDTAAGHACVRYLKEKRIATETFLALDRLVDPKAGSLHLLTQGHPARRLASMCVQHNGKFFERHERWRSEGPAAVDTAMNFLLSQTIFVDDLAEAKQTAYRDARARSLAPRVVTLHGEVISANGNMSVQSISSMGSTEFGAAEQLRDIKVQEEKLKQVEKDLATLNEESSRKRKREAAYRAEAEVVEQRCKALTAMITASDKQQAEEIRLHGSRATRIEELKTKIKQEASRIAGLERDKESLDATLLQAGKKRFAALNRQLGVDDVRGIIQREERAKMKVRLEIEALEDRCRVLANSQEGSEQKLKAKKKLDALQLDAQRYSRDIEAVLQRQRKVEDDIKWFKENCISEEARLTELRKEQERNEQGLKAKRLEQTTARKRSEDAKKELGKHHHKARIVLTMRCGIFRDCSDRQFEIPLLNKADAAALERVQLRGQDIDDLPFQDLEAACTAVAVNFASLPEERKARAEETRIDGIKHADAEYEARISEVNVELEGLNPNMRAPEDCAFEEEKLREIQQKADETSKESQRLARAFEAVKAERVNRFTKCFKHVEEKVHPFYRDLTSYDGNQGGSAYLDLDDTEEPYNGGITFTACPPGKRFFPMELLSGGEKSMASMALLFAMHSFQPPPFMILDEVDAPFDRKNTTALVRYLKRLDFQCLVISLKDTFFSQSDSIVGIFKDKEHQSSGSLSLPLRQLGEESEVTAGEISLAEALADID